MSIYKIPLTSLTIRNYKNCVYKLHMMVTEILPLKYRHSPATSFYRQRPQGSIQSEPAPQSRPKANKLLLRLFSHETVCYHMTHHPKHALVVRIRNYLPAGEINSSASWIPTPPSLFVCGRVSADVRLDRIIFELTSRWPPLGEPGDPPRLHTLG